MVTAPHDPRIELLTLENPVLGLRAHRPANPDWDPRELSRTEVFATPGANAGAPHLHLHQEERFELLSGSLAYTLGRGKGVLRPGQTLIVPPATRHTFRNDGDEEAHFIAEFRPALRIEEFFAMLFGLASDGKTDDKGRPSLLQTAALMREFPDEFFYLADVPVAMQRAIAAPLAAVARRRGYLGHDPRYTWSRAAS
jgi:mannose-6-phosphate isomerase-like protein (cupin superfamily)